MALGAPGAWTQTPLIERSVIVKRALPLWLAAVVPATLAGHAIAYAVIGRSSADGHHVWLQPTLEGSLALLVALCALLAGDTLVRAGLLVHTTAERSFYALLPRLALAQLALFAFIEFGEGTHPGPVGCLVQLLVAALTASLLALFARLLLRCERIADAASRYLERFRPRPALLLGEFAPAAAYALSVRAGRALFSRPPPFA